MSARPPRIEDVDSARRWRPLLEVDNRQRWLPLPPRLTPLPLSRAERFRPGTVGGVGVWGAQTRSVCRQDAGSLDYSCRVFRREVTKVVDLANGGRRSKAILGLDTFRSCPAVRSASPTTDDQPPVDPPAAPGRFALDSAPARRRGSNRQRQRPSSTRRGPVSRVPVPPARRDLSAR